MDHKQFDDLVIHVFGGASRRATLKGVLAGAVAAAGLPMLVEAKNGKGKNGKGKRKSHKS